MMPADILEDARLTTPQLIEKYGYFVETHETVTEDRYLLEFYRILGKRDENGLRNGTMEKPVVLLQAGIMDSSTSWIITGPNRALGYKLADAGYDVWLMNHRGVKGSRAKHGENDPDDEKGNYWDFTFHEIGIYDIPAVIDYIILTTKQNRLNYIGHSQGCASFFVMAAERPEYNETIIEMHAPAPSIFMSSTRNLTMRLLTFLVRIVLKQVATIFNIKEIAPHNPLLVAVAEASCFVATLESFFCQNLHIMFLGQRNRHIDNNLIPIILGHVPGNASVKQLYHFAQLIRTGIFQTYESKRDYKKEEINVPIHIYYGERDTLATKENAEELHCGLKIKKDVYMAKEYGHMDFMG